MLVFQDSFDSSPEDFSGFIGSLPGTLRHHHPKHPTPDRGESITAVHHRIEKNRGESGLPRSAKAADERGTTIALPKNGSRYIKNQDEGRCCKVVVDRTPAYHEEPGSRGEVNLSDFFGIRLHETGNRHRLGGQSQDGGRCNAT